MSSKVFPEYPVLIVDDEEHIVESQVAALRSNGITNIISTIIIIPPINV